MSIKEEITYKGISLNIDKELDYVEFIAKGDEDEYIESLSLLVEYISYVSHRFVIVYKRDFKIKKWNGFLQDYEKRIYNQLKSVGVQKTLCVTGNFDLISAIKYIKEEIGMH